MTDRTRPLTRRTFLKAAAPLLAAPYIITPSRTDDTIVLFDGKTLDGWHINPERIWHGTGGRWQVEDGVLTGDQDPSGSGNGGILLTDRRFGDFELLLDLKPDWGIDSGLFLRATDDGKGFQMMVDYNEGGNVGHFYGENIGGFGTSAFRLHARTDAGGTLTGLTTEPSAAYADHPMAYTCTPEEWVAAWKVGDWNAARVRCVGRYPTITTWINDTKIGECNMETFSHPRYDREQVAAALGQEGAIALQVHGGTTNWPVGAKCRWKNIRIQPL